MNWIPLQSDEDLAQIVEKSKETPQVIFKHSTRCSISSMVKNRLEKGEQPQNIDFHYLDLIQYRTLSNKIASDFHIHHESPQVITLINGEPVFNESHSAIHMEDIVESTVTAH